MPKCRRVRRRGPAALLAGVLGFSALLTGTASYAVPTDPGVVELSLSGRGDLVQVVENGNGVKPADVAESIPVRVVASYSYDGRTVSDPALVEGKSGQVRVNLAVFNATGRLEDATGDVNGHAVTSSRWVATPLSVAASVHLDEVEPDQVLTPTSIADSAVSTNGVVGVDSDGETVVQWAGITGVGTDVAQFSLVVDAKDFSVPTFDLLVQPGFGIDTNRDAQRSQSELVTETLKTLSEAGDVLADSGEALGQAREVLGEAGGQIGRKTVADLNASNGRVAASAGQIASTLSSIDAQASAMFSATGSHVAQQLSITTKVVKDLLGDPSAPLEPVVVDPGTCTLQAPSDDGNQDNEAGQGASVLAVVRGLSARLDALASSSQYCQQVLLGDLDALLGPPVPNADQCQASDSLSCRLWQANQNMLGLIDQTQHDGQRLAANLESNKGDSTVGAVVTLEQRLHEMKSALDKVKEARKRADFSDQVQQISDTLGAIERRIDSLDEVLNSAADGVGKIGQISSDQDQKLVEMKRLVCVAAGLTESQDQKLKADAYRIGKEAGKELVKLLSDTSCPTEDPGAGKSMDGDYPSGGWDSLQTLGKTMRGEITGVSEKIARSQDGADEPEARRALKDLRAEVSRARQALGDLVQAREGSDKEVKEALSSLDEAYTAMQLQFTLVSSSTQNFADHVSKTAENLDHYVADSHERAIQLLAGSEPVLLDGIDATRQHLKHVSSDVFTGFSSRIGSESKALVRDTSAVVTSTNRGVEQANGSLSSSTQELMNQNTAGIHSVVSGAVVDAAATSALLADDIARVLADIGTNTNKGQGLLGAIATSQAHIGVADTKLADSTTQMSLTQSKQREAQADLILDDAALRLSLARLEQPQPNASDNRNGQWGWYSFHLQVGEGR